VWTNLGRGKAKFQRIAALSLFFFVFVFGQWWIFVHNAERKELKTLYLSAKIGDLNSVQRLAADDSAQADNWLEVLAQDENAFPDSRVQAIAVLAKKRWLNSNILARLLWIEQSSKVRRAAAEVFKQRGCDDLCTPAALYSLHAMWGGELTGEERRSAQYPELAATLIPMAAQSRRDTENDYITLLNLNPCASRQALKAEYFRDPEFVGSLQAKLGPC
jgi:hypothetical protein